MFYTKPWADVLIVLLIVVLFLGPKRLPALGRSLGEGLREFKDGITGGHKPDEDEERPALNAAQPQATSDPPVAVGGQAPTAPGQESAEVGSSEHRA